MTNALVVLATLLFVMVCFCVIELVEAHDLRKKLEDSRNDHREIRDKYLSNLHDTNTREQFLRRALEDLAGADIGRAQFALDVVYGSSKKKS